MVEKMIYIRRSVISTLSYALFVLATLNARNVSGTKTFNNAGVQANTKCHNTYTYNSFYAGTNSKMEALLREVKIELSEIREEIRCMKENKTIEKGRSILCFIIIFVSTSKPKRMRFGFDKSSAPPKRFLAINLY